MKRFHGILIIPFVLLFLQPAFAQPDAPRDKDFDLGVSAGLLFPGSLWVSAIDDYIVTSSSPFFRVTLDGYIVPKLAMGVYVNLGFIGLDRIESSGMAVPSNANSATLYEIGGSITPCFQVHRVLLKPSLSIGYRGMHLNTDVSSEIKDIKALGVNASLQAMLLTKSTVNPFIELGFIAQPAGGNKDTDLTFAPVIYLSIGAAI